MSEQTTALTKRAESVVEYIPYGSDSKIKLSAGIVQNLIAVKTRSGKTCDERDAIKFVAMCQARKLNPFEGDAFLIGFDSKDGPQFSLITAHQAFLKRAELHPEFNGMTSGVIVSPGAECPACEGRGVFEKAICPLCRGRRVLDEVEGDILPDDTKLVGGWSTVWFKNRKEPMRKRLNLATFQKPFGVWQTNPAGMIVKCAEADALRSAFPTMLGGMYLREEIDLVQVNNQVSELPAPRATAPARVTISAPPPPSPGRPTTPSTNGGRRGPTLVEEPLTEEERAEAEMGLAPTVPQPTPDPQPAAGPTMTAIQAQLADIVTREAGASFDEFKAWASAEFGSGDGSTGPLAWDAMTGFEDVSDKASKFLVRAKVGMLAGIKQAKGGQP